LCRKGWVCSTVGTLAVGTLEEPFEGVLTSKCNQPYHVVSIGDYPYEIN
jgi:hypothetical protein